MHSPDSTQSYIGIWIENRFEIRRHLADGGMGAVFVAWDHQFSQEVAVKVLRPSGEKQASLELRFETEAKALARMQDPRILRPISWGRSHLGSLYLVTELLIGQALDKELLQESILPESRVLKLMIDVCWALGEAHAAGVVHRDIKPSNIFIQRTHAQVELARVLDFGVVKISSETKLGAQDPLITKPGLVVGTALYMSPEQARGQELDGRSDLYSLGVVMYQCLTGRLPFEGEGLAVMLAHVQQPVLPFSAVAPDISVSLDLELLVHQLLEKNPANRVQSAIHVRNRLEQLLYSSVSSAKLHEHRDFSNPDLELSQTTSETIAVLPKFNIWLVLSSILTMLSISILLTGAYLLDYRAAARVEVILKSTLGQSSMSFCPRLNMPSEIVGRLICKRSMYLC